MDRKDNRYKRYRDKINYIIDNIENIPKERENIWIKRGIFYAMLTSIESMVDIISMIIKDMGKIVKDDSENIDLLINEKNIEPQLGLDLKKANGLRNILVHRYNGVDEELALSSVNEVQDLLKKWLRIIEEILDDFTRTN